MTNTAAQLSVIIPALNEAVALPLLLADLAAQEGVDIECIVCDGGSSDDTVNQAQAFDCQVIHSAPGRAAQMNAGAEGASHPLLLFLHADSRIDDPQLLQKAVTEFEKTCQADAHERVAGHFRLRFVDEQGGSRRAYRQLEAKTGLNRSGTTNGDQGCLLHRDFFSALGGFDDSLPFYEDQRLAEKIRRRGHWITLPGNLVTSARRFDVQGFYRTYTLMSFIMCIHHIGLPGFFETVRDLYRQQGDTELLAMTPFLSQIAQLIARQGWRGRLQTWLRAGRYIRGNAWQLFLLLDVHLDNQQRPALRFYDRSVARLLNNRLCDAITGFLAWIWVMWVLRAWYYWADPKVERPNEL